MGRGPVRSKTYHTKMPSRRVAHLILASTVFILFIFFLRADLASRTGSEHVKAGVPWPENSKEPAEGDAGVKIPPSPKYKPTPTYTPPPIKDPFPLLTTSTPPPIPKWNRPRKGLHKEYDLPIAPPLLIGFTRTWPILLQAVVSYITAGWPPEQIYVVENTGVHMANTRGQLTLQNPFYLNHTQLRKLGVNVIQTPVLLNFAQLQNFYLDLATRRDWPYYFWSHQDVLTLSYEEGREGLTPRYNETGYKTVYELACHWLDDARKNDDHWAVRFFAYDHLALVNPRAYEDVGGWDTLIPYYLTDCDMHSRLLMANYTMIEKPAGTVTDTSTALENLLALYRDPDARPDLRDPNPPAPPPPEAKQSDKAKTGNEEEKKKGEEEEKKKKKSVKAKRIPSPSSEEEREKAKLDGDAKLAYYWDLRHVSDRMFWYKHGERGRNTWQQGQHGGQGEPFYYPAEGLAEGIDVLTEAGREVYRRKWGHRDCDLMEGAGLTLGDEWRVEKDWKD